jgi:hypothetical protein
MTWGPKQELGTQRNDINVLGNTDANSTCIRGIRYRGGIHMADKRPWHH